MPAYNVYRGYRIQGAPVAYNQDCLAGGTAAPSAGDAIAPRRGVIFYYLVSSRCGSGESILGRNSAGAVVPQPFTCPATPRDEDGDGIEDPFDNCPAFRNPSQSDRDVDGLGDVCDP
jgi:hypothetical protein